MYIKLIYEHIFIYLRGDLFECIFKQLERRCYLITTEIFKALSDTNRLRILLLLEQEESSVGHITHTLELQSNVSHQLKILKQARLVKSLRQGQSKSIRLMINMFQPY